MNQELQGEEILIEKIKIFDDPNFSFNEELHQYKYNGIKYESVTNIIKKFCEPFDSKYWSKKKAIDRISSDTGDLSDENIEKVTKEILKEWDDKRDNSCDLGHLVHLYLEQKFSPKLETKLVTNNEALHRINKFEELVLPRLKDFKSIAQELRLFSHTLKISGTIDGLFLRKMKDGTTKLYIIDYKTNGKFKTDKDKNFQKLKAPFSDQWENEHNKYSIQLCLYKLILAEYGIFVDDCALIHIPPSDCEPKIIKCKDYTPKLEMYFGVDFHSKLKITEKMQNI